MSEFINTIDTLGDEVVSDSFIDRSITEFCDNIITSIGNYAFHGCTQLTTVDFPIATSIGDYSFKDCKALTTADFPLAIRVGNYAFNCCTQLTTVDISNTDTIGDSAFYLCSSLTSVNLPNVTEVTTSTFYGCSSLIDVNLPLLLIIKTRDFYNCKKLKSIIFDKVWMINTECFLGCSNLKILDFPILYRIDSKSHFYNCTSLTVLILRNPEKICSLSNINSFTNTPIASGTGYIYVPSALVDSYKAATNWSTYANQFRALEDYTVDGTITGELDATKI